MWNYIIYLVSLRKPLATNKCSFTFRILFSLHPEAATNVLQGIFEHFLKRFSDTKYKICILIDSKFSYLAKFLGKRCVRNKTVFKKFTSSILYLTFIHVFRMSEMSPEREQAATPTLEKRDINWNQLNESLMSGYEGDKEDEGESFFEHGQF